MKIGTPKVKKLVDYKELDYKIDQVDLSFELDPEKTKVTSICRVKKNPSLGGDFPDLVLNGEKLKLLEVSIDGDLLSPNDYQISDEILTLKPNKDEFSLKIITQINPRENTELEGLYLSSGIFCTQNEAEGFRKITYFLDRPDNMATYRCKISANKKEYPVLLANGNKIDQGENGDHHWVLWEDPFPKPCYLFALVAGNLGMVEDTYETISGRKVRLEIFVDKGNEHKCGYAMESLKNSMKWDEETYGLEYDLDIYMIVAVDSFNMGAMENKGLNIFNSAYVLADQKTATDQNFLGVESVIGHEYFHNWTGNRITCRDWFQLTLKEGLTVFRDQEFSSDLNTRTVKRIEDVAGLRGHQFIEDAGPSSHPIKPSEYIEINNFYTSTIYEKGAEVIRMMHTMLGRSGFRKGMDKYFELFDGQAVTTEDFVHALSVANNQYDFEQFKRWYSQKGTPSLSVKHSYNAADNELKILIKQKCPKTLKEEEWMPYHLPLKLGIIGQESKVDLVCDLQTSNDLERSDWADKGFVHVKEMKEEYTFTNVKEDVVLSINRDFSAPVIIESNQSDEDLTFLLANDKNSFNRYETAQNLAIDVLLKLISSDEKGEDLVVPGAYLRAFGSLLNDPQIDDETKSWCISLPDFSTLSQKVESINTGAIFMALDVLKKSIAMEHEKSFVSCLEKLNEKKFNEYAVTPEQVGHRSLKRSILGFLLATGKSDYEDNCFDSYLDASDMTTEIGTFGLLSHYGRKHAGEASNKFYDKWKGETLVFQKWVATQASSPKEDTLENLSRIESLPEYSNKVPNLVRSLIGGFAMRNPRQFHRPDGLGYKFLSDKLIEVDAINPQIAARLASAFNIYEKLQSRQKDLMRGNIQRVLDKKDLSKNTFEILSKISL